MEEAAYDSQRRDAVLLRALAGQLQVPRRILVSRTANQVLTLTADLDVWDLQGPEPQLVTVPVNTSAQLSAGVGIGGPDVTGIGGTGWKYMHLVRKGLLVYSMLSTSATAVVIPQGWTWAGCWSAGFVHTDGNFLPFRQYGRNYWFAYDGGNVVASGGGRIIDASNVTTFTPVNCSSRIALGLSRQIKFVVMQAAGSGAGQTTIRETGVSTQVFIAMNATSAAIEYSHIDVTVDTSGSFERFQNNTTTFLWMDVLGFVISTF